MQKPQWDGLWINANLATMAGVRDKQGDLGLVEQGAIATLDGKIEWIGKETDLPGPADTLASAVHKLSGGWILPGFIDCHTHLVFAGDRSGEFARRLAGASYEEIARAGGGIVSTVLATRSASQDELFQASLPRLQSLTKEGVTTVEIKSGYGLDLENEIKMLRVAKELQAHVDVEITTTFLGAHTLPPEFDGDPDGYIDLVCNEMIPLVTQENLADAVDGFCEGIAFSPEQIERVFTSATANGLEVKLHADQLSDLGGAELASRFGALSADHLEYTSKKGVDAMAAAGVTVVLLPGAYYYLGETKKPPIEEFREKNVPMALATDCNPGSSPITSMTAILNMGCNLFGLTPAESLLGATRNAARALGIEDAKGVLSVGADADFAYWRIGHPNDLCYWLANTRPDWVVRSGRLRE